MTQHQKLASGKWLELTLCQQMANIGSEVFRCLNWRLKGNQKLSQKAFLRAVELFDLTINDLKNKKRLKEICRAKELFCDYFAGKNQYGQNDKQWNDYFYYFNYLARNK